LGLAGSIAVIVLLHPRSTRPKNRRFPLSVLSLAAVLEGRQDYAIVDGNVDTDPLGSLDRIAAEHSIELLAVSVMPGPQTASAVPLCRQFRAKYPKVPILWGGYFPSLYTDATLNAEYVDFAVRGQGQDTFLELLEALSGHRDLSSIAGLSFKEQDGSHVHNAERALRSPDDYPWLPYHRLDPANYVLPTFLGSRTAVHHTSIGCPYQCNFCGVVTAYGRQKTEAPSRTEAILRHLQRQYAINAVQFYDDNFFVREDHAREQAARLAPLNLRWWCEGRVDTVLSYSDDTLSRLKRAGATMVFFGAESWSNEILRQMNKNLTTEQTLDLARRLRGIGIIPEFSFIVGNPQAPEEDTRQTIRFIRKIKSINPAAEIIVQHYAPTPQREAMYGGVDDRFPFPATPDEWVTERWLNFTTRDDPKVPWVPERTKRLADDFELVVSSRWPTKQDYHMPAWGRALLQILSSWRYTCRVYGQPWELAWAQRLLQLRRPRLESL
jgi:radical SAM superfamily enzyme YgiQ (UPF0313 family)